jgi:hypothetical protein
MARDHGSHRVKRGSIGRAALLSGVLTTIVVSIPYVNVLNSCCCALTVLGGVFAAFVLRSDSEGAAPTGQCGMAGMLAGCLSGLAGVPLTAVLSRLAFGRAELEGRVAEALDKMTAFFSNSGLTLPPGSLEAMAAGARATSGLEWNAWTLVAAVFNAMAFSFFGLIGGLIGGALLRRRAAPPPPVRSPPAPAPAPPEVAAADEPLSPDSPPSGEGAAPDHGEIPAEELPLLPGGPERVPPPPPGDPGAVEPSSGEEPGPG